MINDAQSAAEQPIKRKRGRPRKTSEEKQAEPTPTIHFPPILMNRQVTAKAVGMSPSTLASLVSRRRFPAPRKGSDNRVGWLYSEVKAWAEGLPVSDILPPRRFNTDPDQAS